MKNILFHNIKYSKTFKKGRLELIGSKDYELVNQSIGGDAPKEIISAYFYGECYRRNRKYWPKYISKIGHKHYPIESVTENLTNRIGEILGFNMAHSKLVIYHNNIHHLSKIFISKNEALIHGAEIFSVYLNETDNKFVDEIEYNRLSRELFTFEFQKDALMHQFKNKTINDKFIEMIVFDAIVGNNDRHFYNWGVIRNIKTNHFRFSPIYDSARALFWNHSDDELKNKISTKHDFIKNYAINSLPKIGLGDKKDANHFELIKYLTNKNYIKIEDISDRCEVIMSGKIDMVIFKEFREILSEYRIRLICDYLRFRASNLLDQ